MAVRRRLNVIDMGGVPHAAQLLQARVGYVPKCSGFPFLFIYSLSSYPLDIAFSNPHAGAQHPPRPISLSHPRHSHVVPHAGWRHSRYTTVKRGQFYAGESDFCFTR